MIAIKTGCWFAPIPADHLKVGISRGRPRGLAVGYRLYGKLAPGPWFNSVTTEQYLALYNAEILDPLDPAQVRDELESTLGLIVPEFGFETRRQHPLAPPTAGTAT